MNQEYRERIKRHLEAGGDSKYVNVKKKAEARHSEAKSKALAKAKGGHKQDKFSKAVGKIVDKNDNWETKDTL